MDEIFMLFDLYHRIEKSQVMEIFESFPYLFCCDTAKMQRFLGEFRKYKMTNDQIMNLVRFLYFLTFLFTVQKLKWTLGCEDQEFLGLLRLY